MDATEQESKLFNLIGRYKCPRSQAATLMHILQPSTHVRAQALLVLRAVSIGSVHWRSLRVSYANIQFPSFVFLESYRRFVPHPEINYTVSLAPQNQHPARRRYRAHSASEYRTGFASAARRAACQACLCLATPWLVPGSERAWSALSPYVASVFHRARNL
jgi:hypothetical protein